MKKRVFIGSSIEAKELAYQLQSVLSDHFECVLWYEGFFSLGSHFYTDLVRKIVTFDYAIMIGAEDDRVIRLSNQDEKISPRDNVYLEYGLFSGFLSPKHVLLLIQQNCRVASDLSGMALAQYTDNNHAVSLVQKWLYDFDREKPRSIGRKDVELLPTVGIAVGYYYNFVKPFVDRLFDERDSLAYKNVRLNILVPDFVYNNTKYYQEMLALNKGLVNDTVCRFRILVDPAKTSTLTMYDVPSTILALFKTVDYIFENQDGDTEDTLCAKIRALDNFYENLSVLIANDHKAAHFVKLSRYSQDDAL